MLTHHEARERAREAAPAGYRLHTITQARPGRFITRYVDGRWRSRRGMVTADGASVGRVVFGPKYRRSDGEREVQVAARIRADYRQARDRGVIPARLRISVRCGSGYGILVDVSGLTDAFLNAERPAGSLYGREAAALLETLELIYDAYQRDGSDSFQDGYQLRYSGRVRLLSEAQQVERAREREAKRKKTAGGRPSGR
ncbi:hypothetical protein [Streptomyces sp. NRRL B-24484]|uniref:hypothetical protein n=1 Tax=Streptomyces sp. NRRL B-24484 TaxID=1463833 RepID=UPI0004BEA9FC|nr:hypothetical protein [Streptomyces sp. NRRL B-24484]